MLIIEIIGKIGCNLVAMLGVRPQRFTGRERVLVADVFGKTAYPSVPLDSMIGHTHGGFELDAAISEVERATAIELARRQFEIEGYGSGGEKALSG